MSKLQEKLLQKQNELKDVLFDLKSLGKSDDPEKVAFRKNMARISKCSVTR